MRIHQKIFSLARPQPQPDAAMKRMSEQYPEAGDDSALPRKRRDFVEINVGGKNFAAAISTLRANSTYFDALFSSDWYREEETVFVDQDPDAFAVLQSFMRLGSIDSTKITEEILLQAEFLGMDRLLAAVKCVAYCNTNPNFTGSDEEAVAEFDVKYQGITEALSLGVLPKYLTEQKGQKKKEYASISVYDWLVQNELVTDKYVEVHATGNVGDPSVEQENVPGVIIPNCCRFLDALNWLHRHGYTAREYHLEGTHGRSRSYDYLVFSKELQRRTTRRGLSSLIRTTTKATHEDDCEQFAEDDCKQFAAVGYLPDSPDEGGARVQADVGTITSIEQHDGREIETRISDTNYGSLVGGMNWLHKQGYTMPEYTLGSLYERITEGLNDHGPSFKVRMYSRPLQRRTAEIGGDEVGAS